MKKAIIIAVIIVVVAVIAIGVMFWLGQQGNTSPGISNTAQNGSLPTVGTSPTTTASATSSPLYFGDTIVAPGDITATLPAGSPQGSTLQFQAATGTVTLNNFYNVAEGYWTDYDALLLAHTNAYTIWYYRGASQFDLVMSLNATDADEDAAAQNLASQLGVSEQELCALPVNADFVIDRGMDDQQYPLDFCPASGATNPQ